MKKNYVQNLSMIITERCNLDCDHCLRGKCTNKVISDEVIEAILGQIHHIETLSICGGEPLLALDRLEKIFSYIIDNEINVDSVTLTTNGTIYNEELLKLLDYIDSYINYKKALKTLSFLTISWDEYHYKAVERLKMINQYLENIKKYQESKHFLCMQGLTQKIFREGRAESLEPSLTIPLRPMRVVMCYTAEQGVFDRENYCCFMGPMITVNVDGVITECDASIEHQQKLYNYGNVLTDSLEEVCLDRKSLILQPKTWCEQTAKIMRRYATYNN